MKRILLLSKSAKASGGVEYVVDLHLRWLSKIGIETTLMVLRSTSYDKFPSTNFEYINNTNKIFCSPFLSRNLGIDYLKKLYVEGNKNDYILCHQPFFSGLLYTLIYYLSPLVCYERPRLIIYHHAVPSKNLITRFGYNVLLAGLRLTCPKMQICISAKSKDNEKLCKRLNIKPVVLPIPLVNYRESRTHKINISDEIKSYIEKIDGLPAKVLKLVFIGRIASYKGLSLFKKSLCHVKVPLCVTIAGTGPLEGSIAKWEKKLPTNVYAYKFINRFITDDEKRALLVSHDAMIFPSTNSSEAYGIIQLEAMSMGVPVINQPLKTAVPQVAMDKQSAYTSDVLNSPESYAKKINEAYNDLKSENTLLTRQNVLNYYKKKFSEKSAYDIFSRLFL